jgi:hypothetical protein
MSLTIYQSTDARVVKSVCEKFGLNPFTPVSYEDKLGVATYCGLSLRLVEKALTTIRKYKI